LLLAAAAKSPYNTRLSELEELASSLTQSNAGIDRSVIYERLNKLDEKQTKRLSGGNLNGIVEKVHKVLLADQENPIKKSKALEYINWAIQECENNRSLITTALAVPVLYFSVDLLNGTLRFLESVQIGDDEIIIGFLVNEIKNLMKRMNALRRAVKHYGDLDGVHMERIDALNVINLLTTRITGDITSITIRLNALSNKWTTQVSNLEDLNSKNVSQTIVTAGTLFSKGYDLWRMWESLRNPFARLASSLTVAALGIQTYNHVAICTNIHAVLPQIKDLQGTVDQLQAGLAVLQFVFQESWDQAYEIALGNQG